MVVTKSYGLMYESDDVGRGVRIDVRYSRPALRHRCSDIYGAGKRGARGTGQTCAVQSEARSGHLAAGY